MEKSYTMDERTAAQNKAFNLKRAGYKVTRIVEQIEVGRRKDDSPIFEQILISFGYYEKSKNFPKEIKVTEMDKYNFEFIYYN